MEISKFLGPSVSVISQVILDGDTTFDLETKTFILNSTILTYLSMMYHLVDANVQTTSIYSI